MSASRQIVGSIEVGFGQRYAMMWDASGAGVHATILPLPPSMDAAELYAINDVGVAVGRGWTTSPNVLTPEAFTYKNGVWRNLNDFIRLGSASSWHLEAATSINASGQIACTGRYNGELGSVILTPLNVIAIVPTDEMFALLREGIGADVEALERASGEAYALPLRAGMSLALPRRDLLTALAIEVLASRLVDERACERVRHAALDAIQRSTERLRGPIKQETLPPDDSSR